MANPEKQIDYAIVTMMFMAALVYGFFIFGWNTRFPGDLGDARFNQFILEHVTHWLMGDKLDLASPPLLYPYRMTLFFSDTHFGSVLPYFIARSFGADRETAFNIWFATGEIFTFLASFSVFQRWNFPVRESVIAACLFSFNLAALAQIEHAQLTYRFAIPLAVDAFILWRTRPSLYHLCALILWTSLQCLLSVYLGLFLALLLGCLVLAWPFMSARSNFNIREITRIVEKPALLQVLTMIAAVLSVIATLGLFASYWQTTKLYNLARDWSDIVGMIPSPQSYLIADRSQIWPWLGASLDVGSMRHEHQLFIGGAFTILLLTCIIVKVAQPAFHNLKILMACALVITLIVTTVIHDQTLYLLISLIPGFSALRAVTRIILVLAFPAAVLAAIGLYQLRQSGSAMARFLVLAITALILVETLTFTYSTTDVKVAQIRTQSVTTRVEDEIRTRNLDRQNVILASISGDATPFWMTTLDVMLAAQDLGVNSLSGYTGNYPPGYHHIRSCADLATYTTELDKQNLIKSKQIIAIANDSVTGEPYIAPCD